MEIKNNKSHIQIAIEKKNKEEKVHYPNSQDYTIGCYTDMIDKISKKELNKLIKKISLGDYTDVDIKCGGIDYVVEICYVDDEVDLVMLTKSDYISRYGD